MVEPGNAPAARSKGMDIQHRDGDAIAVDFAATNDRYAPRANDRDVEARSAHVHADAVGGPTHCGESDLPGNGPASWTGDDQLCRKPRSFRRAHDASIAPHD